jgi:hypothetical protein
VNIADELERLAVLRREGSLSDSEFANAKQRLLGGDPQAPAGATERTAEVQSEIQPLAADRVFRSSRWSRGNLFFPDSLSLAGDGILFRKGRMLGSSEERISYRAIASLRVVNGVFLSNLSVETSGGSQPIYINGLWKSDAREIQELIRGYQQAA